MPLHFVLLFVLLPLVLVPGLHEHFILPRVFFLMILACLAGFRFFKQGFAPRASITLTFLLLFLFLSVILLVVSPSAISSLQLIMVFFSYLFIFALITEDEFEKIRENLPFYLAVGMLLPIFYGYLQWFGIDPINWNLVHRGGRGSLFSTFGNVNWLAHYLVMAIPLLWVDWFASDRVRRILIRSTTLLALPLLFITRSRGAIIAFFVSFIVYLFLQKKRRRRQLLIVLLLIVFVLLSVEIWLYSANQTTLTTRFLSTRGITDRLFIWQVSAAMFRLYPWGAGAGNYSWIYPGQLQTKLLRTSPESERFANHAIHAHNDYLEIAIEFGMIGFCYFLWLNLAALRNGFASVSIRQKGALVSLIAYLVAACFGSPFYHPVTLGLLLFVWEILLPTQLRIGKITPWGCRFSFVLFFFIVGMTFYFFSLVESSFYLARAKHLLADQKIEAAAEKLVKAVNTNVVQPEADYLYGSLLLQRTTVDKPELTNQALFHFLRASKGMAEPGIFYNQGRSYELLGESERALTSYKLARQLSVWSEVFLPASRKEAALLVKMGENDRAGAVLLAMLPCSMDSLTIDEIILLMQKLIAMNNVYQAAALGEVSIKRMTVSQTVSRMRILHLMASAMVDTAPEWATFALLRLEKLADQQRSINLQLEPLIDTLMSVNLQELNSQAYSLVTCKIRFLFVRFFIL